MGRLLSSGLAKPVVVFGLSSDARRRVRGASEASPPPERSKFTESCRFHRIKRKRIIFYSKKIFKIAQKRRRKQNPRDLCSGLTQQQLSGPAYADAKYQTARLARLRLFRDPPFGSPLVPRGVFPSRPRYDLRYAPVAPPSHPRHSSCDGWIATKP